MAAWIAWTWPDNAYAAEALYWQVGSTAKSARQRSKKLGRAIRRKGWTGGSARRMVAAPSGIGALI
jgi:hypothetical protein